MPVVGIVAEGPTDALVFEGIISELDPAIRTIRLHPPAILGAPGGWKSVRSWCRQTAPRLQSFMQAYLPKLDVLVIHVDCSMAHNENALHPCPPAHNTANSLRAVVISKWLQLPG